MFCLALVIFAGLSSRSHLVRVFPDFVGTYAGDTLWALAAFLTLGIVFPVHPTRIIAATAIGISFGVECSQLYQADWINRIRSTLPGALLLGSGFLWSDFACYTAGVLMGVVGEGFLLKRRKTLRSDS